MTRKRRRLVVVLAGLACLGLAAFLVLNAFEDGIVFFRSPTDVAENKAPADRRFRLGGLVEEKSVKRLGDSTVSFRVTDLRHTVPVTFRGILPDLFREGQGVIAEGRLGTDGVFVASEVLAKHDETYMPKEVADALKKSGMWKDPKESETKK